LTNIHVVEGLRQDFATISYSVPGYFVSPDPSINLYKNSAAHIHDKGVHVKASIAIQKLNDEVLFRVPDPASITHAEEVEFLDVSARRLALVVVPPHSTFVVKDGEGLKVIQGRGASFRPMGSHSGSLIPFLVVHWTNRRGDVQFRAQATAPFSAISTEVHARNELIHTGASGAAFLLMRKSTTSGTPPYSDMSQLKAHNIFPERAPADVRAMNFPWVKVEDRSWANGRFKVKNHFYWSLLTQLTRELTPGPRVLQPRRLPRSHSGRLGQRDMSYSNVDGRC